MKKITGKRAKRYEEMYDHATTWNLEQVYGRYSTEKARAYRECIEIAANSNAYDYRIISHNTMQFTFAFHNSEGLHIITKDNHYLYEGYLPF